MYKLYMRFFVVLCTNSIRIHAGLNGLKAGQTAVIAFAVLIHNNIMQIGSSTDLKCKQGHAFSIFLVQPLVTSTLALLSFNWYPSSVFAGDTYTYFAGMVLVVAGILGDFSKTLMIFFAPQILNFLVSLPQLLSFSKCPTSFTKVGSTNRTFDKRWNTCEYFLEVLWPVLREVTLP